MKNAKLKFTNRLRILSSVILGILFFQTFHLIGMNELAVFALIASIGLPFIWKESGVLATGGAGGEKTDEEKLVEKINKMMSDWAEKNKPTQMTDEELSKKSSLFIAELIKKYPQIEKLSDVLKDIQEQAEILSALKEKGMQSGNAISVNTQIKEWLETNKTAIASIKGGSKSDLTPMVIKLNSPMTPANTYNGSAYLPIPEFQAGATEIVRLQPTFWDFIKKGKTNSAAYVWINKKNPEGAAAFIGPGVAKPGISFEIATEISNAKKVAVSEKTSTELLEDIDGMQSWIEQELTYQLKQKINTTLMTGVASSTVPAGIQTISVPYSLTTVSTTNPNNWDAVRAAVAQLRSGNLVGNVTAFMNPIDYANMVMTKATSQGQIFMPMETGALIVEDNNIPVGFVQVAILDYYKILIYKSLTINFGWENDDFTKNLVTGVAEMRLHQFFSENHTGAFIYDELDNIKTAITAV